MARYGLSHGVGRKFNILIAQETGLDPATVTEIRSSHVGGDEVRLEVTSFKSITVARFNELLRAAQEGESAPVIVIEGSNAVE